MHINIANERESEWEFSLESFGANNERASAMHSSDKVKWVCIWSKYQPHDAWNEQQNNTKNKETNGKKTLEQKRPQIQKYKLPKRFTKIKWNSTMMDEKEMHSVWASARASPSNVCVYCVIRVAMHCCLYHNLVLFMADTLSPSFLTVIYHLFSPNCYCSSTNETQFCIW